MEAKIFESHAHYDSEQFDEDRHELLMSMPENGIGTIIDSGANWDSVTEVVEMAAKYPHVYAAVGMHPDEVGDLNEERFAYLKSQCQKDKVVAVGEIGLDYYWDNESHDVQKYWFIKQLDLARELDLPVIIHSREAAADTLEVMKEHAQEYVKMGYYIGVGGVVTFKNAKKLKEVVEVVPLDRILLETDSPYLAPTPYRGKRNSSLYIPYIAEEIANIKGVTYEEVVAQTEQNGKDLFRI